MPQKRHGSSHCLDGGIQLEMPSVLERSAQSVSLSLGTLVVPAGLLAPPTGEFKQQCLLEMLADRLTDICEIELVPALLEDQTESKPAPAAGDDDDADGEEPDDRGEGPSDFGLDHQFNNYMIEGD